MNKSVILKTYKQFDKADAYIIGFIYRDCLYMITLGKIPPRYTKVMRASVKNGRGLKLNLILSNKMKEQLIRKGAIPVGTSSSLDGEYNRGVEFEKFVYNLSNQTFRGKDNVPFYKAPDIIINDINYQIKFEGAQIVTLKTIKRLEKGLAK